ncbi:MAG: hypothetical protein FWD33_01270 [Alphaproteobacteria bacterium]|nr:hypothetical protein [Alphaproteobacteria bacterium]
MPMPVLNYAKILAAVLIAVVFSAEYVSANPNPPSRAGRTVAAGRAAPASATQPAESANQEVMIQFVDEAPSAERVSMRMAPGARTAPAAARGGTDTITNTPGSGAGIIAAQSAGINAAAVSSGNPAEDCRKSYFDCMDQFCMTDDTNAERCVCSARIVEFDKTMDAIRKIQADAEKLMNEGVEREMLGARANHVFGANQVSPRNRVLNLSFDDDEFFEDVGIDSAAVTRRGALLFEHAAQLCKSRLDNCDGNDAEMARSLYAQQVRNDCNAFNSFLNEQKRTAENNKLAAEREVRRARTEMLDVTNRFNRGECLIQMRDCVATKGGCGANFENCLDASLLRRRTMACENILDQCMAVRRDVERDWREEERSILAEAARHADRNRRGTCLARIDACLEESCAPSVNDQCLTDIRIARGVCPVMDECDRLVPGIAAVFNARLASVRVRFCQTDLTGCFRDRCGVNFNNPACVGKTAEEISGMCPQQMFPSCAGMRDFAAIQGGVMMNVDFALMQGCVNLFSERLNQLCGMDMTCLDENMGAPRNLNTVAELENYDFRPAVEAAVNRFFVTFEQDPTLASCSGNLGTAMFTSTKMVAQLLAEQRASRNNFRRIAEFTRREDVAAARAACESMYERGRNDSSPVVSATFEPNLRNCRVCRNQTVIARGGESKGETAMKVGAGGLAAGAGVGAMFGPLGAAIGGGVGLIGGMIGGAVMGKGIQTDESELTSCEDVNM